MEGCLEQGFHPCGCEEVVIHAGTRLPGDVAAMGSREPVSDPTVSKPKKFTDSPSWTLVELYLRLTLMLFWVCVCGGVSSICLSPPQSKFTQQPSRDTCSRYSLVCNPGGFHVSVQTSRSTPL